MSSASASAPSKSLPDRTRGEVRDAPVALADVAAALEGNPRAVWFRKAGLEKAELVGNVAGSRARLARAFGVMPETLLPEVLRRLRNRPAIVEVPRSAAPVQQVVLTGDEVDVTRLPVHLQHGEDGREIVRELDSLRRDPGLTRDERGRYALKTPA